jgi:hypothetical protein
MVNSKKASDNIPDVARRCPMLGHEVTFNYCLSAGNTLPCRKIFDCWFERFDITTYMKENFDEDVLKKITAPSKPKITSLVELIQKAKNTE